MKRRVIKRFRFQGFGESESPIRETSVTNFNDLPTSEKIQAYASLRTFETDFDRAQGRVRAIASTWLLAALAAFGGLIIASLGPQPALAPPIGGLMRQTTLLIAVVGLIALWRLDQRIYQRLLHATFAYGCQLEVDNPELPQIRNRLYAENLDITGQLGWFYKAPILCLLVAAWFSAIELVFGFEALVDTLLDWRWPNHAAFRSCAPALAICFLQTLVVVVMMRRARRWPSLNQMLPEETRRRRPRRGA